jgi:hypothetical protein
MAGKEYQIVDGVPLYNGAQDTDGGRWIRIDNDEDHRILAAAVAKQIKNTEAARGTLSALDPNAPHMVDYITNSLQRVLESVNGALPASAQLAGTPIGDVLNGTGAPTTKGRKRGRKGSSTPETAATPGTTEPIVWADDVPSPRPAAGEAFWPALHFGRAVPELITAIVGFDAENEHFVVETANGRRSIVFNAAWNAFVGAGEPPVHPDHVSAEQAIDAARDLASAMSAGAEASGTGSAEPLEDSQIEAVAPREPGARRSDDVGEGHRDRGRERSRRAAPGRRRLHHAHGRRVDVARIARGGQRRGGQRRQRERGDRRAGVRTADAGGDVAREALEAG